MALYIDLINEVMTDSGFKARVVMAIAVAAETVRAEDGGTVNHANRMVWAKNAVSNPESYAKAAMFSIVAQNKDSATSAIIGSTDAVLQTAIDAAVDMLAGE